MKAVQTHKLGINKLKSGTQAMQGLPWWNTGGVQQVVTGHADHWRSLPVRPVEYHVYTRQDEPDASSLSLLSWNVPGRAKEVAVTRQYAHPLKRGASMRNFFQFLLDAADDKLPAHELVPLARKIAEGQGDLFLPCHAIHKGERIGFLMGYELYQDFLAFLSGIACMEPTAPYERYILSTLAVVPASGKTQDIVLALATLIKNKGLKHGSLGIPVAQPIKDEAFAPPLAAVLLSYKQINPQAPQQTGNPTREVARLLTAGNFPQAKGAWYEFFVAYWMWTENGRHGPAPSLKPQPQPEASETAQAKETKAPRPKVKLPPPPLLEGMNVTELLDAVRKNGFIVSELEGLSDIVLREVQERKAPKKGRAGGRQRREDAEPRLLDMNEVAVRSKIAVMEWKNFLAVDQRRYPATKWLEQQLGYELEYHRGNTVVIGPERLGELPGLVAGRDKPWADRLYVVRIEIPSEVDGEEPTLLAGFPAGWMDETEEWWMPGLFGTPIDPTILDFGNPPDTYWDKLRKAIPAQPAQRRLNVRTLGPSEDAPEPDETP